MEIDEAENFESDLMGIQIDIQTRFDDDLKIVSELFESKEKHVEIDTVL